MLIFILLFLFPAEGFAAQYKSHDQIVKEMHEPGHIPQGLPSMKYPKVDEVIPAAKRKKIKERKKKKHKKKHVSASLWSLIMPSAEAACVTSQVIPDPKPSVSPEPEITIDSEVSPSPTGSPSPIVIVSPTPMPSLVPPSPSPTPLVTPTVSPTPSPDPSPTPIPTPSPSVIPPKVIIGDLRPYDSYVRNQFGNSCTAHATLSGMENMINHYKVRLTLSARYLWSLYQQLNTLAALSAASKNSQIQESYWPEASPTPVMAMSFLSSNSSYKLSGYQEMGEDPKPIIDQIDKGNPVYIAMQVPTDLASCRSTIRPTTTLTSGGHAMLIVGYAIDEKLKDYGGGYFIVKNSWGVRCGDNGYHYFGFNFCQRSDSYCDIYSLSGLK